MVLYTLEQCWEILGHYFENHCNNEECVRKLRTEEMHCQFRMFVILFRHFGILIDKPKHQKAKIVHTPENTAAVAESALEAPSTPIHRRSQQFNISETLLRRILHKDLGMATYKVQLVKKLKSIDHPMHFRFAK